jgi:hypothetical protein
MTPAAPFTWQLHGSGTITSGGLFTAYGFGNVLVQATCGTVTGQTTVSVTAPPGTATPPPQPPVTANLNATSNIYSGQLTYAGQIQTYNQTIPPGTLAAPSYLTISLATPANPIAPLVAICNSNGQVIASTG